MGYGLFHMLFQVINSEIGKEANVILLSEKRAFQNSVCIISLQGLRNLIEVHFFVKQVFSFHTWLALNTFHFSFSALSTTKLSRSFLFLHDMPAFFYFPSPFFSLSMSFPPIGNVHPAVSRWNQTRIFSSVFDIPQSEKCHARFPDQKYNVLDSLSSVQGSMSNDARECVALMQYEAP